MVRAVVGDDVFWLGEEVDFGDGGKGVWEFGRGPEGVACRSGKHDES